MADDTSKRAPMKTSILFVDLDNTLLATDILWEAIFRLIKLHPFQACLIPLWILRGKVFLKQKIVKFGIPAIETLPVNESVRKFLENEKKLGRHIVLATASHKEFANPIADYFGLFDGVIATANGENLGGNAKLQAMKEYAQTQEFEYIGDRSVDIPIWRGSNGALVVNPTASLRRKAGVIFSHEFQEKQSAISAIFKAMRLYQWVKNLLLFLPISMAHTLTDITTLTTTLIAFFTFSFCASAVYLLNDLVDLESDRIHPRKKQRPFASGQLPLQYGIALTVVLFTLALSIAAIYLEQKFFLMLIIYVMLTSFYSFYAKQLVIVDVLMLAGLYTFRILAGGAATNTPVSAWMVAFSMFLFLSLAFVKRYTELAIMKQNNTSSVAGRGYIAGDMDIVRSIGPAAGMMAVLVLALYINSADVVSLYAKPHRLWFIEPLLLYWILRVWFLAHRGKMNDDPIVFALKDSTSYLICLCVAIIIFIATVGI